MGQYYTPYLRKADNTEEVLYSASPKKFYETRDFNWHIGNKITEHSWIGNWLTDFISWKLYKNPMHVIWLGDYAEATNKVPEEYLDHIRTLEETHYDIPPVVFSYNNKWIVNHSQNIAFQIPDDCDGPHNSWAEAYHYPISLLTALGNGKGGGDYYSSDGEFLPLIGTWCNDIVSIEDEIPEGYKEIKVPSLHPAWA